ncbi:MAG: hypothetical protein ACE5IO_03100 [Thermoplasmata archaeon]
MVEFQLKKHHGVVLEVGGDIDSKGASFACAFQDEKRETYLFYSSARDVDYRHSTICLAVSGDGIGFKKIGKVLVNQEESFCRNSALTPAVFEAGGLYFMLIAGALDEDSSRQIGIADANNLVGPWRVRHVLLSPEDAWEGYGIDTGPAICTEKMTAYYSNVSKKRSFPRALLKVETIKRRVLREKWWHRLVRKLGVLELQFGGVGISARRFEGNPLSHLNGPRGSWNESLFCPGYARWDETHLLFSASSLYSSGPPFKQYIGVIEGDSPYFGKTSTMKKLIDGPVEKELVLRGAVAEIALDTPSPIILNDELWLYYAVMDRHDGIWKTALSIYRILGD